MAAAAAASLDLVALADHDTLAGIPEAQTAAAELPVEVLPAIEMSTTWEDGDFHILGYFVDPAHGELLDYTRAAGGRREERMRTMVTRLRDQGVDVSFDAARRVAGERGTLGRPHLAQALVDTGYASSIDDAFDRFIGNAHAAYVPTQLIDPARAIGLIEQAGGVAVWAHPPAREIEALLPAFTQIGLRGIEVYRPANHPRRIRMLERVAADAGLLVSGGSDWHGPDQGALGTFRVEGEKVAGLLAEGGVAP